WLANAVAIVGPRGEAGAFTAALAECADGCALAPIRAAAEAPSRSGHEGGVPQLPAPAGERASGAAPPDGTPVFELAPAARRRLSPMIRKRLPPLLAGSVGPPRPILVRADVPTHAVNGRDTDLDQWTYVCDWLSRGGVEGLIRTLQILDEA